MSHKLVRVTATPIVLRILRPKSKMVYGNEAQAFFYSLVSQDTREVKYRLRQRNIEIAFSKNIEMTGFYHTILKFPDT